MTLSKLRNKIFACLLGMLVGVLFVTIETASAQTVLQGIGGSAAVVNATLYAEGGIRTTVANTGSGGTITTLGGDTIHTFTTTGTSTFIAPLGVTSVRVLVVGGGGAGGRGGGSGNTWSSGGGGGGGGVVAGTNVPITALVPISITVGTGGGSQATANTPGASGSQSIFNAGAVANAPFNPLSIQLVANGGGGGGGGDDNGVAGASTGGGGANSTTVRAAGTPASQGNLGTSSFGATNANSANRAGGGGGGSGSAAGASASGEGGDGGTGTADDITGVSLLYGAGGGGAGTAGGAGGSGVGGAGGSGDGAAGVATASRGAGGGGTRNANSGAASNGVVIIRYTTPPAQRIVHTFTTSGTFTAPLGLDQVHVFAVAGGGGGGRGSATGPVAGGGGGAGGVRFDMNFTVAADTPIAVTVGGGGAGATTDNTSGTAGGDSIFSTLNANGGGGGGGGDLVGVAGGSGGGGGAAGTNRAGGASTPAGQGFAGGTSFGSGTAANRAGGGGGGAAATGSNGATGAGGAGGAGISFYASGAAVIYAAGGGGNGTAAGAGGSGGIGGAGGVGAAAPGNGTANRGAGGGGSRGVNAGAGSGGTVIIMYFPETADYIVHTYTASGSFTAPAGVSTVDVLAVGGGGGGGRGSATTSGGGGGGGAVIYDSFVSVTAGSSIAVTVGTGGGGATVNNTAGSNGIDSSFSTVTAPGGRGGGGGTTNGSTGGGAGSNGGGGGGDAAARTGGAGVAPGFAGGSGFSNANDTLRAGGGGGGAGAVGGNGASAAGGAGGAGASHDISGATATYGGGGGGADANGAAGGAGGAGGGGAGGGTSAPAVVSGNLGGGGGGSRGAFNGASGGTGVVIIRYRPPTLQLTTQPPASADTTEVLSTQPQVTLLNAAGAAVNGITVTASIDSGNATLGGTTGVATSSGVAAYTNLALTVSGTPGNVFLRFSVPGSNQYVVSNAINLMNYYIQISNTATQTTCVAPSTPITISVRRGSNDTLVTNYAQTVTLLSNGDGTYTQNTSQNAPSNTTAGDMTIAFHDNDDGDVIVNYTPGSGTGVTTFTASASGGVVHTGSPQLEVRSCKFRIIHDGTADMCIAETITIEVRDSSGALVTGYAGNVNMETSDDIGNWSGTGVANGAANDGAASYDFDGSEGGDIVVGLTHPADALINIDLNSGSFTEDTPGIYDPNLDVDPCLIRFSFASPTATTCAPATVTVGIYNSAGTIASNFSGVLSLTTSTGNGNWLSSDDDSDMDVDTLVDTSPNNGTGTLTFDGDEGGNVALSFSSTVVETLNFNASFDASVTALTVDGTTDANMDGDPDYDPDLPITACLPTAEPAVCYVNNSVNDAITLPTSAATQGSRMVLMYVGSTSHVDASSASIEGQPMTLLRTEYESSGLGTKLQVFGILDANLPVNGGPVDAAFVGSSNTPAMCLVVLQGVAQVSPTIVSSPQINGDNVAISDPVSTDLLTNENNSIIIGVSLNSQGGTTYTSTLDDSLWQTGTADPAASDWAGFYDYQLAPNTITVTNSAGTIPNRQVIIALALAPSVEGDPAVVGYVPVTLFETFSGRVGYRTTGNTLRQFSNPQCSILSHLGAGSSGTMTLPTGSTVKAAYLYWAGSGYVNNPDDDVTFSVNGGTPQTVTAEEVFLIQPNQVYNDNYPAVEESFFAGYKEVTTLVSSAASTSYQISGLEVVSALGTPWRDHNSCVAGWALVVVYENPIEELNVINLFHGFQPFYHSSFTLVPRNFRMASPNGSNIPNGQVTHVTFEGDNQDGNPAGCTNDVDCNSGLGNANLNTPDEVFELQNDPDTQTFTELNNPVNTVATLAAGDVSRQYNSTLSYPLYNGSLDFDISQGTSGYFTSTTTWGTDIDTYYVEGGSVGEILYEFGNSAAEQITTRYSTGQDIVLLVGEFISVTNAPIADLEVFVTDGGTWRVDTTGAASYTYTVTNNGNGTTDVANNYANGDVILTGTMPNGITINNISAPGGWACPLQTASAFTCVFEIAAGGTGALSDAELDRNESLPNVVVTVNIDDSTPYFPLIDNDVTTVARLAHVGDYYDNACDSQPGVTAGIQPNPNPSGGCSKPPQFDNVNDLNKYLIDIDNLFTKDSIKQNNVHSNTRNVRGIETNLSIDKTLVGVMQTNEPVTYEIAVTNLGPDTTTKPFIVTDTLPPELVVDTAGGGPDWNCTIMGQNVECEYQGTLTVTETTDPIVIVTDPISEPEGTDIQNSALVTVGSGNFDLIPGNNSDTVLSEVTGPLAVTAEKFLITVTEDNTTIGGLEFDEGDLVLYDPVLDTATAFLLESSIPAVTNLGDIDAVHVLPNGHILLSTNTDGSTIKGVTFNAEDIVMYDPILQVAALVFDGSAIFTADTVDIDAFHVVYNNSYTISNWNVVLSTTDTATFLGGGGITFQDNDLVSYDMGTGGFGAGGSGTLLVNGASATVFGADGIGDIAGIHVRYNDANKYILTTSSVSSVTIGGGVDPLEFEAGEVVEIDLTNPLVPVTTALLCDNMVPCVGDTPVNPNPGWIDGLHVVETGYLGHFQITSPGGNNCTQTSVTIRKHAGTGHTTETGYQGSVIISNSINDGTWEKHGTANGTLTMVGSDSGTAIYTFTPADNGQVMLYLSGTVTNPSVNVNVRSNVLGAATVITEGSGGDDPNFAIGNLPTDIKYGDNFGTVSYNNNDGVNAGFAGGWVEELDDLSATTGKITVGGGVLRLNNNGGGATAIRRQMNLSSFPLSQAPVFSFYLDKFGSPGHSLQVQVRGDDNDAWTTLETFTNTLTAGTRSYAFTGAPWNIVPSSTTQIRFVMSGSSASTTERYEVDNVLIDTETNQCDIGSSADHYAVVHDGAMVSCMVKYVAVTPHSLTDDPVALDAGTVLSLQTSTNKGYFGRPRLLTANGTLSTGNFTTPATNVGTATYMYTGIETTLYFPFYYPDVSTDTENVTITVSDNESNTTQENSILVVSKTGLNFYNDTENSPDFPTLVAGMPSYDPNPMLAQHPGHVLYVQALRASDDDPLVCEDAFANNTDVTVQLTFECINPATCSAGSTMQVTNNNNTVSVNPVASNSGAGANHAAWPVLPAAPAAGSGIMPLRFTKPGLTDFTRAEIILNYSDAGSIQIHGRYNVPVPGVDGGATIYSNEYVEGSGSTFVVRPFAYSVDFLGNDRRTKYDGDYDAVESYAADANSPNDSFVAGAPFNITVSAVSWQQADDTDGDGEPDNNAVLFDNPITPNYGNETPNDASNVNDNVELKRFAVAGGGDALGVLALTTAGTNDNNFNNGVYTIEYTYSEVGIIDITAELDNGPINGYLGGGENIAGAAYKVGRFKPNHFVISSPSFTDRPLFTSSNNVNPYVRYTNLGEEFTVHFTLTAYNATNVVTQNYEGGFAKLTSTGGLNFQAIDDVTGSADISYLSRLALGTSGQNLFTGDFANWNNGVLALDGNLVLNRQPSGAPEAPLSDIQIAVAVNDSDGVLDRSADRTVDLDCIPDCMTSPEDSFDQFYLIGEKLFRYGRLRLENGYGTDIADLDGSGNPVGRDVSVRVSAEYWTGTEFTLNRDDIATPYASARLKFVDGTFTDNLADLNGETPPFGANNDEPEITSGEGVLFNGNALERGPKDVPLHIRAPRDAGNDGTVLVELDLDTAYDFDGAPAIPVKLDFLKFDWRSVNANITAPLSGDVDPDGTQDNPRAMVEFGTFRGNDRIINWQEIFE